MIGSCMALIGKPAIQYSRPRRAWRALWAACKRPHVIGAALGLYAIAFTYISMAQLTHERRLTEVERRMTFGLLYAESGQRGYLLTGDRAFLVQYRSGLNALTTYEPVYRDALVDSKSKNGCFELESLLRRKTAEMSLTIAMHDQFGQAAAIAIVDDKGGNAYTEKIYRLLLTIRNREADRVAPFQLWSSQR
jgi:adenylate cyclase